MKATPHYEKATLYQPKRGAWLFVWYNVHPDTNELIRIRKSFDINRIKDRKERLAVASEMIVLINSALKMGYNHFTHGNGVPIADFQPDQVIIPQASILPASPAITLVNALQEILKIRVLGKEGRTVTSYRSFVNTFTDWLAENGMIRLPLADFTDGIFYDYLSYKKGLGHGNRNMNDTICYFKDSMRRLKKKYQLSTLPLEEVETLPVHDSSRFQALSDDELRLVKEHFLRTNPRYYCYTLFTAHEFVRPAHITFIRRSDIDFKKNTIAINAQSSKNKKVKTKQLMKPVKDMLLALGYDQLPPSFYLFGTRDFQPAETPLRSLSVRSAELWKQEVIDHLKIPKHMYGLKYTGSSYFVNNNDRNNIDMLWLQKQLEHHSLSQTEIYLRNIITPKISEKDISTMDY